MIIIERNRNDYSTNYDTRDNRETVKKGKNGKTGDTYF